MTIAPGAGPCISKSHRVHLEGIVQLSQSVIFDKHSLYKFAPFYNSWLLPVFFAVLSE